METDTLPINDPGALTRAMEVLTSGGLVAFPTDTVYVIGAIAFDEKAVSQIYEMKARATDRTFPVLIGGFDQLPRVTTGVDRFCEKLARRFWPGPLTVVLPRGPAIPDTITLYPTIGVRIPDFTPTRELLRLTGPLAVTSADLPGQSSPSTVRGVQAQWNGKIPLILDGGVTPGGTPSTIVECSSGEPLILREGPISLEQILNALA